MDGVARPSGAGVTITFGGETLILEALTLKDFGLIENHLLSQRENPLMVVRDVIGDLPPEMADKLLDKAYRDAKKMNEVSAEEVAEWMDTFKGMAFSMWLCLEKRYKDRFTLETVLDVMDSLDEEDLDNLKNLRDQAAGLDESGNSTGGTSSSTTPTQ
jgi:hypothetical protein